MFKGRGSKLEDRGSNVGLDVAIDRAVREMLDVEQPAGLRARVLRQIESGPESRGVGAATLRWKLVLPITAAAVLILAVIAPWRTGPLPATDAPPKVAAVEPPVVVDPVPPSPKVLPTHSHPDRPRPARPAAVASAKPRMIVERTLIAATLPADAGVEIDPLAAIDPIRIASVGAAAIEHKEVVVTPLAPIAQLQIAPLTTPAGRF